MPLFNLPEAELAGTSPNKVCISLKSLDFVSVGLPPLSTLIPERGFMIQSLRLFYLASVQFKKEYSKLKAS